MLLHSSYVTTFINNFWSYLGNHFLRAVLTCVYFCSSLSKCGAHQVLSLLYFQNISPKAQCKCFWNANHVRNLLRSISLRLILLYNFYNNLWTTCRFRSTIFWSTCNRPYACTEIPNLSANCGKWHWFTKINSTYVSINVRWTSAK